MEKIDIRQMRVLVLLVRYKSVSRVAELLEISQQGVSSHLKKLQISFPPSCLSARAPGCSRPITPAIWPPGLSRILADIDGVFVAAPSIPPAASAPSG